MNKPEENLEQVVFSSHVRAPDGSFIETVNIQTGHTISLVGDNIIVGHPDFKGLRMLVPWARCRWAILLRMNSREKSSAGAGTARETRSLV